MMKRLLFLLLIAAGVALFLRTFVVEGIEVASASMEPALPVGTYLFLEKVSYRFRNPRRGEIVVFPSPVAEGRDLIKRIIAIPGDEIAIRDKRVSLNGEAVREPYVQHTREHQLLVGDTLGPLIVPRGSVFVMGDNRDVSGDSRDWKDSATDEHIYFVPIASLKGRILIF